MRASIAIFHNSITYPDTSQSPEVPDEVFEAAKRVSVTKKTEVITNNGFYVIEYSDNGPFAEHVDDNWFPVKIYRIDQWSCGGITNKEFGQHLKKDTAQIAREKIDTTQFVVTKSELRD